MAVSGFIRQWSGTFLAAFLTLALLVPAIDSFVCIADVGEQSAVTHEVAKVDPVKQAPNESHDDGDSSCIHGHCHHWVGFTKVGERIALNLIARHFDQVRGAYNAPPSAPQNELLRPPQA